MTAETLGVDVSAPDGTPVPPRPVVTYPDDDRLHIVAVADCSTP